MANPTEDIFVNDFRAGIVDDYYRSDHGAPIDGAAQLTNTYSCYADPLSGALCPLPLRQGGQTQTIPFTLGSNHQPTSMVGFVLLDIAVVSPRVTSLGQGNDFQVHALLGFWWDPTASATYRWYVVHRIWTYDAFAASWSVKDAMFLKAASTPGASPYEIGGGMFAKARGAASANPNAASLISMVYAMAQSSSRNIAWDEAPNTFDATEAGVTTYESDYAVAGPPYALPGVAAVGNNRAAVWGFPDPGSSTTFSNIGLPLSGWVTQILGHQGRILGLNHRLTNFGDGTITATHETFEYTPVNYPSGAATEAFAGEENPAGFGAAASLTTNQLLLVKHSGGGVLVSGGLDRFQVTRLPFLEPTYGITYRAVNTPIGVVYASRTGIYAYAGGPTATKLSDNLDGFFFDHNASGFVYKGNRGSLGFFHPFVLAPNGFAYDIRTKAWWRLTIGTEGYNCYDLNPYTGELIAGRARNSSAVDPVWDYYNWDALSTSYSWESQPLIRTRENLYTAQEIELVVIPASGATVDTVTATITAHNTDPSSANGATSTSSATVTFSLSSSAAGKTIVIRKDIAPNVTGRYMTVRLQSAATSGPAPKILSFRLRGRDGTSIAKN